MRLSWGPRSLAWFSWLVAEKVSRPPRNDEIAAPTTSHWDYDFPSSAKAKIENLTTPLEVTSIGV